MFLRISLFAVVALLNSATLSSQPMEIDKKIESLLFRMTLEEKVGQMNQYNGL